MLPYDHNRVSLSNLKDRFGLPAPKIDFSYGENEQQMARTGAPVFPTSTPANPTLAVMALAARTADRIKELAARREI